MPLTDCWPAWIVAVWSSTCATLGSEDDSCTTSALMRGWALFSESAVVIERLAGGLVVFRFWSQQMFSRGVVTITGQVLVAVQPGALAVIVTEPCVNALTSKYA